MIDLHTHILPALDDGATSEAEALEMCRMAAAAGTRILVATPHMFCDVTNPACPDIARAHARLAGLVQAAGIPLDLRWAAEVRLVDDLPRRIKDGAVPTLDAAGRYVLLEGPYLGRDLGPVHEVVFQLQLQNIVPVLAHPERLEMFRGSAAADTVEDIVARGAVIQVNAQSIPAPDAPHAERSLAVMLLQHGLVHVVASDGHNLKERPPVLAEARARCAAWIGPEPAALLFCDNPARILAGDPVIPLPATARSKTAPDRPASGWRAQVGRWFGQ